MKTNKKFLKTSLAGWDLRLSIKLLPVLIASSLGSAPAWANPTGAQTVSGQVSYSTSGNVLTITNSNGAIINWQNFSINGGETTRFIQQNANSSVLNRIVGQDPTQILGTLQSNGKVYLINPNGILFGAGAQINVNGLVASTLNLSNENYLAGKLNFNAGTSAGSISNQGSITTPSGGQVYLIAPKIENNGIITSPKGDVLLAAGRSVQLVDSSSPDTQVVVSAPTDQVVNLGQVIAQGGKVGIYGALINQRGTINANSAVVGENGKIIFKASGDTLLEAGSVTTATGAGKGGDIQVLGNRVGLTGDAKVDASGLTGGGTVLVGGDYHGDNASVQNAKRTFVGSDTQIKADAINNGDGGKVIVWSDETTRAYGNISAHGGAQGGNGGFVEVSGKQNLVFHAKVDVGAANGNGGTLLLDPSSITIVGDIGDGAADGTATFQGSSTPGTANFADAGPSVIYQSELEGMAPGTNIVLEATDSISTSGAFGNMLTLANNSNLTMRTRNAATDGSGTIGINLIGSTDGANLQIKTQGTGTITLQTGTGSSPQSADIQVGKLTTDGSAVTINASGAVSSGKIVTSSLSSNGGNVSVTASGGSITLNSNIDARSNTTAGNVTLNAAGAINVASFISDAPIIANQLTMTANGGIHDSFSPGPGLYLPVIVEVNSLSATNNDSSPINISSVAGNLTINGGGVTTVGGDITLFTDPASSLTVAAPINAGVGSINLNAGSVVSSGGTITGSLLNITASDGIGHGTPLVTHVSALSASSNGSNTDININNTGDVLLGPVAQLASGGTGSIHITSTGTITTDTATTVSTEKGNITLTSTGALTVNGAVQSLDPVAGGNILLTAGATGNSTDKLTVSATGEVHSTTGTVTLQAGDAITITNPGSVYGGSVTQTPYMNGVTLAQCIADPSLTGCSSVLPSLATCTATPSTAGCSVVLPSMSTCIATPSTAGCTAVLPTLSQCIASPTDTGCSVVLPSLSTCTAAPSTTGCSVVLPTLSTCIATPSTAGCTAVLPTLSQCTTTPTLPGCSVVLPSLSACIATPTLAGCSAVLPTVSQCTATPTLSGCSVVLPSLSACIATPTLAGCSAVLPTVSQCTATPTLPGCSVVLPSLSACITTPTLAGCSAVLPTVSQCTATPTLPGCSVVLPSLSTCTTTPSTAGCAAVLPSLATCTATPTAAGCSAVLPTLAACTSTPTLAGCATVLPPVNICLSNPTAAGCAAVLPPASSQTANEPVQQAINNTVNIINTVTTTVTVPATPVFVSTVRVSLPQPTSPSSETGTSSPTSSSSGATTPGPTSSTSSTGSASSSTAGSAAPANAPTADKKDDTTAESKKEEKKDDKANTILAKDNGVKKDEPVRKLYCN
jgi:filamentous hemagglutinin family protein